MAKGAPPNDLERLPWLEPYHAAADDMLARPAGTKREAGLIVGGVAALAAALTVGYYIGQRDPLIARTPVPVAIASVTSAPTGATVLPPEPESEAPPENVAAVTPRTAAPIRQREVQSAQRDEVGVAQERAPASRTVARAATPGPAGQVIQLGAFSNSVRANRAYQRRVARYPMLQSMPHVIVPIVAKPSGQTLYALRLGTSSRQQSRVVCRNLRASGDHCLVIG